MEPDNRTQELLKEIRDAQREHLDEYRRVTRESLELQRAAVKRQEQATGIYRRMAVVGGVLVVALLGLLAYLLVRWWPYLMS